MKRGESRHRGDASGSITILKTRGPAVGDFRMDIERGPCGEFAVVGGWGDDGADDGDFEVVHFLPSYGRTVHLFIVRRMMKKKREKGEEGAVAAYFCDSPMKVLGQIFLNGFLVLDIDLSCVRVVA